ncbi:MAG: sulfate ABC transporter substrate-binding protein [Nocardioidaceae bacterium]|nr:sulfate ABC transporter substrate-binding protein [Nocardioidaceae bacterium]MCL2614514.1 sulfate ABC transporter substrate-binding protein [Nocardioidaceae bacterium]
MNNNRKAKAFAAVAVTAVVGMAATACTSTASGDSKNSVAVVGFSVLEQANKAVYAGFDKTPAGKGVTFTSSYGASGDQSRAVAGGVKADLVHFSLEPDMQRLVDAGLVAKDWSAGPTKGIGTDSVVVFIVRKGNPKHITSWDDLVKPGVSVVTPNPGSSGAAKWNLLAAWEHIKGAGGTDAQAKTFVSKLLKNTPVLPASGREATSAFVEGNQDVEIAYESDAIEAKQAGEPVDYVVPKDTLLIQEPAAVTTTATPAAKSFLGYMESASGQELYAESGFRPVPSVKGVKLPAVKGANDPSNPFPQPTTLYTVDKDLGGWDSADSTFFNDGSDGNPVGIISQLIADSGSKAEDS